MDRGDQGLLLSGRDLLDLRPLEDLGGGHALFLHGGNAARENGLGDGRSRHAHVEGVNRGPFAGALLAGGVQHDVDERLLGDRILLLEDVGGDFDQEAVEGALVPLGENLTHLGRLETEQALHERVGLTDHLHVAVFNTVVHHLDVMARAVFADVGGAGHATLDGLAGLGTHQGLAGLLVHLGRDRGPDRLELVPGRLLAAGHERRAETRTLFAAGHAGTDETKTLFLQGLFTTNGVGPQGVATVDDNIVGSEQGEQPIDHRVGGLTGLHEDDNLTGQSDGLDEFFEGLGPDYPTGGVRVFGNELIGLLDRAVVNRDLKAVIGDVKSEILTHHGEADESDVGVRFGHNEREVPWRLVRQRPIPIPRS